MRSAAAESLYQLAATLQTRGQYGDVAIAALPVVTASLESPQTLGMRPLLEGVTALRDVLRSGTRRRERSRSQIAAWVAQRPRPVS